jgi:hypothetical protein
MRKMDWILAAVIGVFLAGAAITQAAGWAVSSLGALGHDDGGSRQNLVVRMMSIGADSPISRQCPVIFRRP